MGTSLGAYELNHEWTFRIFNKGLISWMSNE